MALTRRIDKLPLPCRSSPGFLVNRVLFPYLFEALHAAGEGIGFNAIDRAAVEFGMPMGPMELSDVVGLDVLLHVGEIVTHELRQQAPAYVDRCERWCRSANSGARADKVSMRGGTVRWCGRRSAPTRPRILPTG